MLSIGVGGLGFKSWVIAISSLGFDSPEDQNGSVANGSPPLRRSFGAVCA